MSKPSTKKNHPEPTADCAGEPSEVPTKNVIDTNDQTTPETGQRSNPRQVALAAMAVALILVIQAVGAPKPVTAVCINSVFILVCHKLSLRAVCTVAITSPVTAILMGHLPPALAPMGLVVALANMSYVYMYTKAMNGGIIRKYCLAPAAKAFVMIFGAAVMIHLLGWVPSLKIPLFIFGASQIPTGIGGILGGQYLAQRITLPGERTHTR